MKRAPVGLSVYSGLGASTIEYLDAVAAPFESLWFPDHLQSNVGGVMEGWSLFTYALARYPNKICGHQVLCNEFRHPALLAKMVATAQVLSEGRVVLGIGAGWHRDEAAAFDITFPDTPTRVERLIEAIALMRSLFTGASVTITGDHYSVTDAEIVPSPDPIPPVMVGGSGERHALRAVATSADWWNHIYQDVETFNHKRGVLDRHCQEIGRDPREVASVIGTQVLIGESERQLRQLRDRDDVRSVDRNGISGTPEQVTDTLLEGIEAGAARVIVGFADSPRTDGTEIFVDAVLPRLVATD